MSLAMDEDDDRYGAEAAMANSRARRVERTTQVLEKASTAFDLDPSPWNAKAFLAAQNALVALVGAPKPLVDASSVSIALEDVKMDEALSSNAHTSRRQSGSTSTPTLESTPDLIEDAVSDGNDVDELDELRIQVRPTSIGGSGGRDGTTEVS